ncbi:MAG: sigma-70 family RNA polymerase sigma factor [Candidatus Sulfotelmatobacter sp.]
MHVIETSMEGRPEVGTGLLSNRVRELDDVVSRNLSALYKSAFRYLGNAPDAEDAVQDALLSAYKHLAQFRGQARISTWLTAIVINAARMKLRRRRGISPLSLEHKQGEDGLALLERIPDSKPTPEEICFSSQAHQRLLEGANQLSPTLRRTFQLRDIEGLSTRETARRLGVPEGTVKAQVARARGKLAQIMTARPRRQHWRPVSLDSSAFRAESVCP